VTSLQVTEALAEQSGMEMIYLENVHVAGELLESFPRELAEEYTILPLQRQDGTLRVATSDPYDLGRLDELRFRLNTEIDPILADPGEIRKAIVRNYGITTDEKKLQEMQEELSSEEITYGATAAGTEEGADTGDAPVIRLVQSIIVEGLRSRASDIHIEPFEKRLRIRFRIDGICYEVDKIKPPKRLQNAIISRIKIQAKMQIEEKRKPPDGPITLTGLGREVDLRVSVLPATWGETIVMRILEKETVMFGMPELGFMEDDMELFGQIIKRPNGIVLVTGPTGSGKTTTLYAALNVLNRPDVKIITAEDPVEYHLSGINQAQVNHQIGFTFARILRAMLRQAPNIILIGEIRDKETAEMAIEAALTGHLVFSTLHTNDAPSAITRLIDMGVKSFLVASSVQAVMAQRLVRVICSECKQPYPPDEKELLSMNIRPEESPDAKLYRGAGCKKCGENGYKGRKGIFEIMVMNRKIRELSFRKTPTDEIRREAIQSGMRTLRQDGIRKVLSGLTTLDEVNRETHLEVSYD
jgi:type II secretion system protein E